MKSFFRRGGVLVMTLVFVTMFLVIFIGLSSLVTRSYREAVLQANDELAFQIADSGLNYARWRLAHDGDNYSAEQRVVNDQYSGELGTYSLIFDAPESGSTVVTIESTGETSSHVEREVTLKARYGRPSLARYASITNEDVWYSGPVNGPVHANGGIRMDGSSDSLVTSALETYACQTYHDCNSPFETKPGVWGSGTIAELWEYPVAPIDYSALTLDLLDMKAAAEAGDTYYGPSGNFGYQLVFNDDNTYTISRVTARGGNVWSWTSDTGWQFTSHDVGSTTLVESKPVPTSGIIYVEDKLWMRGDVRDRVAVAAGVFPDTPATNVDIILNGDISYGGVQDGTRALAAVAQRHILIPWSGAPDDMNIDGAYVAQQGSFHRRYYGSCCGADAHSLKNSLTRYGMIASSGVPTTSWVNGSGTVISGFQSGQSTYDSNFLYAPPPFFPASGQYEFISWEEQQ